MNWILDSIPFRSINEDRNPSTGNYGIDKYLKIMFFRSPEKRKLCSHIKSKYGKIRKLFVIDTLNYVYEYRKATSERDFLGQGIYIIKKDSGFSFKNECEGVYIYDLYRSFDSISMLIREVLSPKDVFSVYVLIVCEECGRVGYCPVTSLKSSDTDFLLYDAEKKQVYERYFFAYKISGLYTTDELFRSYFVKTFTHGRKIYEHVLKFLGGDRYFDIEYLMEAKKQIKGLVIEVDKISGVFVKGVEVK